MLSTILMLIALPFFLWGLAKLHEHNVWEYKMQYRNPVAKAEYDLQKQMKQTFGVKRLDDIPQKLREDKKRIFSGFFEDTVKEFEESECIDRLRDLALMLFDNYVDRVKSFLSIDLYVYSLTEISANKLISQGGLRKKDIEVLSAIKEKCSQKYAERTGEKKQESDVSSVAAVNTFWRDPNESNPVKKCSVDELINVFLSAVDDALNHWSVCEFSDVVKTNISTALNGVVEQSQSSVVPFLKQTDPMKWALAQVYNETFKLLQNERYYIMGSFNVEGEDVRNACLYSLHRAHDMGYISDADYKRECNNVKELVSSMLADS